MAEGATCLASNSSATYGQCIDGQCACGNLDQPCCHNGRPTTLGGCASFELYCDATGSNATGLCKPCGRKDGPCCLGNTCTEAGTGCIQGVGLVQPACRLCGGARQPCCPSRTAIGTCRDPGATCNVGTGLCPG
jgi:hypothetical protein